MDVSYNAKFWLFYSQNKYIQITKKLTYSYFYINWYQCINLCWCVYLFIVHVIFNTVFFYSIGSVGSMEDI